MKKSILILSAAFALIGCKQQGGTSDQYSTDTGSSITNMRNTRAFTNYSAPDTNNQGAASSVGGTNTGSATSSPSTNSEGTRPGNT